MRLYEFVSWIGIVIMASGFLIIAFIQLKKIRGVGYFSSLTKDLSPQEIKLIKLGILFLAGGLSMLIVGIVLR